MKFSVSVLLALGLATAAQAKLPAPSEEAKAKAADTAAKAAHNGKIDNYKLCVSMDRTAAHYYAESKKTGKEAKPPTATPACTDPGPYAAAAPAAPAPPLEAAGAHSPTKTAASPPSTMAPAATQKKP